ncbi:hypothetical protein OQH60_04820 [Campylobacter sp. MIT 21-1685]|uniref:hypothetical protein n=1 Tax=unclassified Campylobacter TaxID=2593542 RepID=UPI00224A4917|nr:MULTISPECIES: hypothetical protein [unclassified Campylobacter]MCX2683187.1 hypothetical protein [Campylobacter sp. MIT 21-1684]MCX2751493.1 hypothetical protein [Campylobacter sp. MIT 21-1682]MCX2807668.1 hypothetical protein [Campylobacter sp. MIT 21-1685]
MKKIATAFLFYCSILSAQAIQNNSSLYELDTQKNTILIKNSITKTKQKTPTNTVIIPKNSQIQQSTNKNQNRTSSTINTIAVVVDKEPITTYDIEQTMKALQIDRAKALVLLINEKIEFSQMKQLGIFVNELELDEAIKKFLAQNHLNLEEFKKVLNEKGQNYANFRANLKKDLEKRKLYDRIANFNKTDFSEAGAKKFYKQHKEQFKVWTQINVNIYSSSQPELLENILETKKASIKPHNVILNTANSDSRLLSFLSQIPLNEFSPILNGRNGYEIYEVKAKADPQEPDYEEIKNEVLNAYITKQRQDFTQDYFEKLRAKVTIEYLQ